MRRLFLLLLLFSLPAQASIDLHAHAFMKEGMTWAFNGDFFSPLKVKSWSDRYSTKINVESLNESGLGIVVATLYAHPLFVGSLRDSVRRQIAQAERFVKENPSWIIARDAMEARKALQLGKRVMILALEGADGVVETDADIQEFVIEKGVKIITLLHLTDDDLGGVAFLRGFQALASPIAFIKNIFSPNKEAGVRVNREGLTDKGRELSRKLMDHGVWVDLAHASDSAQRDLIAMMKERFLPLLYTHTVLRKYHQAERAITDWQLEAVAASRGIVGLMPSPAMLDGTLEGECDETIQEFAKQYAEVSAVIGADAIAVGSDFNGTLPHLKPGCTSAGGRFSENGLLHIGYLKDMWGALAQSVKVPPLEIQLERFLSAWEKITPRKSR